MAVDSSWAPCSWFDPSTRIRAKIDLLQRTSKSAIIVDYKTGRQNPQEHTEQLELYMPLVLAFYPTLEEIKAEMLYVDHGTKATSIFTDVGATAAKIRKRFEKAAAPIFLDKTWEAKPGYACRWCAYSSRRGGPCDKG